MSIAALNSLSNLLVTIAVGPGIVTHEYAHYAACKLTGVAVLGLPAMRPTADDAVLEHESVSAFGPDFAIAVAPFVANSLFALACFAAASAVIGPLGWLCLWLGVAFGFTSFPSDADTETLFATAAELPRTTRPVGYLLAAPVRAASWSVLLAGVLTFGWTSVLFAAGSGMT
ncbi:hypothetical protein KTS45_02265 [Halomicroarcula limicola]|uniref:DUF3267 domain-containing protein n=1 Tax=Haloarcula limicola TaxID=1429915 RepID=A0A8J7Y2K6_9EURY|nr:hypothetical protein [Halomicroarcula limicola]MBV0923012.1 hypothetical protein [Halomicroarcula limicola]